MFVLQSQDAGPNERAIKSKEEKLLEALKEENQKNSKRLCLILWIVVVPLLIAIITFSSLIYLWLEEQGRSISDIFYDNTKVTTTPEPIIVVEEAPEPQEEEHEEQVDQEEEEKP